MTVALQKSAPGWSVDKFAAFWAKPDPTIAGAALAPDAVGHWPRFPAPVRGKAAYVKVIRDLVSLVPDLALVVAEHATSGEFVFLRWIATGTYEGRPFEATGIDRVHVRDGVVLENYICSDHPVFAQVAAMNAPADAAIA